MALSPIGGLGEAVRGEPRHRTRRPITTGPTVRVRPWGNRVSSPRTTPLRFDGVDDVVSVPDDAALRPAQLSVEAWVYPETGISYQDTVVTKTSWWGDGYGLFY